VDIDVSVTCCSADYTGRCPEGQHVTSPTSESTGIFDDLTTDEILTVINYTRQIVCFNQRDDVSRDGNVSRIALIELRPPVKYKALYYLDSGGPAPVRNARVVLYRSVLYSLNTRQCNRFCLVIFHLAYSSEVYTAS